MQAGSHRRSTSFFFNDTPTTEIYTLSLHDALPICPAAWAPASTSSGRPSTPTSPTPTGCRGAPACAPIWAASTSTPSRSEEHTSELQSQSNLVCRLLLEKKKNNHILTHRPLQPHQL